MPNNKLHTSLEKYYHLMSIRGKSSSSTMRMHELQSKLLSYLFSISNTDCIEYEVEQLIIRIASASNIIKTRLQKLEKDHIRFSDAN